LADADAGRLEVDPSATALEPEMRRTVEAFVQAGRAPVGRVTWAVPPDLRVHADARRVGQILRNLIENALVHAPGSPIRISANPDVEDTAMVRVTVGDAGPGLDPAHLPFVFDRLYRADPSRARETGGSGLGLAIVRELVEAQGGGVGIESAPGEGARLWFTLPGIPGNPRPRRGERLR
jgi:signal transduction histidine kinase